MGPTKKKPEAAETVKKTLRLVDFGGEEKGMDKIHLQVPTAQTRELKYVALPERIYKNARESADAGCPGLRPALRKPAQRAPSIGGGWWESRSPYQSAGKIDGTPPIRKGPSTRGIAQTESGECFPGSPSKNQKSQVHSGGGITHVEKREHKRRRVGISK